jgi:hypothetical protein
MGYWDEEFYNEPSEFDQQVDEFKKSLMNAVKKEFLDEMGKLQSENSKLQTIKDSWEDLKSSYEQKTYELEQAKSKALTEAKRLVLAELIKDYQLILYKADTEYIKKPKCNNCDNARQLHFKTPGGKDVTTNCDCNDSITKYIPSSHLVYEFRLDTSYKKQLIVWYKQLKSDFHGEDYFQIDSSTNVPETIYDNSMEYGNLKSWQTYFKTEDECQKYCDWLNKNRIK